MSTLAVTFNIVESSDGKYFTFTDTTGDYPVNPTGWLCDSVVKNTTTNPMRLLVSFENTNYSYTFTNFTELASKEITPFDLKTVENSSLGTKDSTFTDGIYSFQLQINIGSGFVNDYDLVASVEGFAAIITGISIREFLSYRMYLDYKTKDEILEKMRLLNNLAYASSIGSQNSFSENLLLLEQIQ